MVTRKFLTSIFNILFGSFYLAVDALMIFVSFIYISAISQYDTGNTTMLIAMPIAWLVVRFIILSWENTVELDNLDELDNDEKAKNTEPENQN